MSRRYAGTSSSRAETLADRLFGDVERTAHRRTPDDPGAAAAREAGASAQAAARETAAILAAASPGPPPAVAAERRRRERARAIRSAEDSPPTRPASDPPRGMHTIVSVTANGRFRFGTYSDESAAAFGIAPPRPNPAKTAARSAYRRRRPTAPASSAGRTPGRCRAARSAVRADRRDAAERAADHHANHPGGLRGHERRTRQVPLAHQRRQRGVEQLVVEPVENDGLRSRRRGTSGTPLHARCRASSRRRSSERSRALPGLARRVHDQRPLAPLVVLGEERCRCHLPTIRFEDFSFSMHISSTSSVLTTSACFT